MPPAATTGTFTTRTICGGSCEDDLRGDVAAQKHTAVPARFDALCNDHIGAVILEPPRLVYRGR
jgi:hypothetical protein